MTSLASLSWYMQTEIYIFYYYIVSCHSITQIFLSVQQCQSHHCPSIWLKGLQQNNSPLPGIECNSYKLKNSQQE